MNRLRIVTFSNEDLELARNRKISVATLAKKYGVARATLIKNLSYHGIGHYVLRTKRPEERKVIEVDQRDIDLLTAKKTSFIQLCRKYKTTDGTLKRSLKKLGVEWQHVGCRKRIKLSAKDKRDFLNSKTTVRKLSAKYEVSGEVIKRHLSELGHEPKTVTTAWLKPRLKVIQLRKMHTLQEIAELMEKSRQRIHQMVSSYEIWKASVDSYERRTGKAVIH